MSYLGAPEPSGHRVGVFGIWEQQGRILLVQNPRAVAGVRRELWDLPGGTVRPGEQLEDALRREWAEETECGVRVGDLLLVTDGAKRRRPEGPPLYTWRAFVFRVEGKGAPCPGPGITRVEWVPVGEVPGRLEAPYHGPLRDLLRGGSLRYARVTWTDPLPAALTDPLSGAPSTAAAGERLRRLLVIAAAAAGDDADLVARETQAALADGTPAPRVEEALLQVVPFAGFPRALAAFAAARPHLGDAAPTTADAVEEAEARRRGAEVFGLVYAETAARVAQGLERLHPALARWTQDFAYGRVLARPGLEPVERELIAVAILTTLGGPADALLGHMRAARRLGASREDIEAALAAVPNVLGEGRRDRARALLARL